MGSNRIKLIAMFIVLSIAASCGPSGESAAIEEVHFTKVAFKDNFWAQRVLTNNTKTVQHCFMECEETERLDAFAFAAGLKEGVHHGYPFNDTDIYKTIEGAAYALWAKPDPELEAYVDKVIELIGAAQAEDGYIYTAKQAFNEEQPTRGGKERWSDVRWGHELYCFGHMYEAGAAYYEATGKRSLLDICLKNADLVCETFGPGKLELPPGHQEIEIGLVKLYKVTGEQKYLDMAKYFLDIRGISKDGRELWGEYAQDHKPVLEQDEVVGHAVRASYMYSGMADVAAQTGDTSYIEALDKLWENMVLGKLYITGGFGATGSGEAFGGFYDLPNMSAYCETCASIAGMFWNQRMFLHHGDAKYIDVLERTLYNAFLAGISMDGTNFFYPNPLESVGQHKRTPWFGCACCPPNVARFIASVGNYFYATRGDRLYVNLFAANEADINIGGKAVKVVQETNYPWDGDIRLTIEPDDEELEFEVSVRVPVWATGRPVATEIYRYAEEEPGAVTLKLNGEAIDLNLDKGFANIKRAWKKGDVIELSLPMTVHRVLAHEKVVADNGRVAIERGPIVFCVEWPDAEGGHVRNLVLGDDVELTTEYDPELLNGVQVVHGNATAYEYRNDRSETVTSEKSFTAIPYYAWAHRGPGEMQVWLAREESVVNPLNEATIASTATVSSSSDRYAGALNDQLEPTSSSDEACPMLYWWPNKGTTEWVQYDFDGAKEVSIVEVYWFDEGEETGLQVPESWRILYKDGDRWSPVYTTDEYGVEKDTFNRVVFETVRTTALRLEIKLREDKTTGIYEWKVQ